MKIYLVIFSFIFLSGCTYTANPYPMKTGMVSDFHSNESINLVNAQTTGIVTIENSGGSAGMKVNLREATDSAISLFRKELEGRGINYSALSDKKLSLSLENLYMGNYFFAIGCTATLKIESVNGLSKRFKEHNTSGIDLPHACNFAITKAVASAINDEEIRSFIDPNLGSVTSSSKKLAELKNLYLNDLITEDEFNNKKAEIISNI